MDWEASPCLGVVLAIFLSGDSKSMKESSVPCRALFAGGNPGDASKSIAYTEKAF